MKRRTEIICTIGPACSDAKTLRAMAKAGMDIARLNFSHGTHADHQKVINTIRRVNKSLKSKIRILQDLEGYRIRIGRLKKPLKLIVGKKVWVSNRLPQSKNLIPLDCDFNIRSLKLGMHVFIADGTIDCEVVKKAEKKVQLKIIQGGMITSKKGVNIPALKLAKNIFTEKDSQDIKFALQNKVDFIAQSFVRNKDDILRVVKEVKTKLPKCKIIAKIENKQGVANIDSIIKACDGIMVARGDLGVSMPIWHVPILQKKIIWHTNKLKKMDITATQMLESMIDHLRPTRAEVSDVANAIFDRSDCVMLSGETAIGQYPVEVVCMMRKIIEFTEKSIYPAS